MLEPKAIENLFANFDFLDILKGNNKIFFIFKFVFNGIVSPFFISL